MKTDIPNLEKSRPGVIINKDAHARESYMKKRMFEESKSSEIEELKETVNFLKSEMHEITFLLKQLVRNN